MRRAGRGRRPLAAHRTLGAWPPHHRSPAPDAAPRARRRSARAAALPGGLSRRSSPAPPPPAAAGCCSTSGSPRAPLWWLALPAFGLLGVAVHGRRGRAGFGLGTLFGLGFLLPLLRWTGIYVGPVPWLALSAAEALFVGAAGAGIAVVSRLRGAPLWAAAVWVGAEALRARVPVRRLPLGPGRVRPARRAAAAGRGARRGAAAVVRRRCSPGSRWGRPARRLAPRPGPRRRGRRRGRRWPRCSPARWPRWSRPPAAPPGATVTIAAVQGNVPRLGLDFNAQRRAVLDNHVRVTEQLAADVAAGRRPAPGPGAVAGERLRHRPAAQPRRRRRDRPGRPRRRRADRARHRARGRPDPRRHATATNSVLVWQPGVGVVDRTDKRRVQPFGEYLPWRPFFRLFSAYADRAGQLRPRHRRGRRRRRRASGSGVAICWEIAFDDLVADSVAAGAQVLAVPSNNATFGLHRHDLPAAGDVAGARRRARPRRARRRPPAASAR